ncbi:class I SAM-dependent methyltransferase [Methanobrevibacter filiformis]|uniref:tRNA (Cmo5U34)-methyltransferase n=1 Tax=Methanobrevibacter filiformis TaxID=55758 RepID=A0A166EZD2_9EURY|nr:class I SAM-dependent methyltransferase [Methanobrevibacter filiformis]KZX17168.1 tRNA (cmo5U34)-methyltransferase [Methanobrevibacter filiformis]
MEDTKERFEEMASDYNEDIVKLIPKYNEMLESLLNSVEFNTDSEIKVLELGSGTGILTKKIKERFPNSEIVSIDLSYNMVEKAKENLKSYGNIEFKVGDFTKIDLGSGYDVVISSLAIHHLEANPDKIELFSRIYDSLKENGIFYNADVLLGSSEYIKYINSYIFKEYLKINFTEEEILKIAKNREEVDYPSTLFNQLNWLERVGFRNIEVVWKYYGHGVYGGKKRT